MKKIGIFGLSILLTLGFTSCGNKEIMYNEGVYEGIGQGHIGPIKVKITTDQYEIKEIEIIEDQEIPLLGEVVYKKIPLRVIKVNGTDVDVVSGATFTSNGLIEAIEDGLEKAKIKEEDSPNQ